MAALKVVIFSLGFLNALLLPPSRFQSGLNLERMLRIF